MSERQIAHEDRNLARMLTPTMSVSARMLTPNPSYLLFTPSL